MTNSLLLRLRQRVRDSFGHVYDAADDVDVVRIVLHQVRSRVRRQVAQTLRREKLEVTLLGNHGRELGVEEVGESLMEDLASWTVVVEVGDKDRKRVLGGFVHVEGEGDLPIAETVNLMKGQGLQERLQESIKNI